VNAGYTGDLGRAQPLTLESMRVAQRLAQPEVSVELFTAQLPEDRAAVPDDFSPTPDLTRTLPDVATFGDRRPLPLLADILERLYNATDAEYLIYTNLDIVLAPHFYLSAARYIQQGYDALIINRRRISENYFKPEDLPLVWTQIGKPHPGFDCFVFHRGIFPRLQLFDVAIGLQFSTIGLGYCLWTFAHRFRLLDEEFLTQHVGMEVMGPRDPEYYRHSRDQFRKTLSAIGPHLSIEKFPYSDRPLFQRYWHWAANPNFSVGLAARLELKNLKNKWRRFRYRLF
jgi:hypothetical protein